jgi:hypothetical protein
MALPCRVSPVVLARISQFAYLLDSERSLIMKKTLLVLAVVAVALFALVSGAIAQKKPDVAGTWVGYAIVGDGSRVDFTVVIEKGEAGYTGKLSDTAGMIPESPLRNIVFKDKKLTFDFDFPQDMDSVLIRLELTMENETLKGAWFDPDGDSNIVELTLKK